MTYTDLFYEIKGKFMGADVSDIREHLAFEFEGNIDKALRLNEIIQQKKKEMKKEEKAPKKESKKEADSETKKESKNKSAGK